MRCAALSLDLDETVVDYSESTLRALEAIGGHRSDLALWRAVSARAESALDEGALPVEELDRVRIRRFHEACSGRSPSEHELSALVAARRAAVLGSVRAFPDALRLLDAAASLGLRCIAVSNSYAALREGIVERLGLARYFTHVTFCGDGPDRKPDATAFHSGLQALGCPAELLVHIGDELRSDVGGARAAGAQGVHLDRSGGGCRHAEPCLTSLDASIEHHRSGPVLRFTSGLGLAVEARHPGTSPAADGLAARTRHITPRHPITTRSTRSEP